MRDGNAAIGARQFFGIDALLAANDRNRHQAASELERGFDGLLEPFADAIFQQKAIHDDFDGVVLAAVERDRFIEIFQRAIHARTNESGLRVFLEFLFVFALASANHGR